MPDFLLSAASASLLMTAVLVARQAVAGRRDLALCLATGAVWFLYQYKPSGFGLLLPLLLAGPYLCNRAFRAAFEARPRPAWLETALAATLLGFGGLGYIWPGLPWAARVFDAVSLYLFIELPVVVWRGRPDDLVAARRQLRLWFLAMGAGLSLAIALPAILGHARLAAIVGAGLVIGFCLAAAALGDRLLAPVRIAPPQPSPPLDDREQQILRRLRQVMTDAAIWRDPGLTLSTLARRLAVPEHRLRRVIHLGEGQRHFSAYVSGFRLGYIKTRMDDPAQDDVTLLTLAVEAGYSSLSAFNRAFLVSEGVTPGTWRGALKAARTANTEAAIKPATEGVSAA